MIWLKDGQSNSNPSRINLLFPAPPQVTSYSVSRLLANLVGIGKGFQFTVRLLGLQYRDEMEAEDISVYHHSKSERIETKNSLIAIE